MTFIMIINNLKVVAKCFVKTILILRNGFEENSLEGTMAADLLHFCPQDSSMIALHAVRMASDAGSCWPSWSTASSLCSIDKEHSLEYSCCSSGPQCVEYSSPVFWNTSVSGGLMIAELEALFLDIQDWIYWNRFKENILMQLGELSNNNFFESNKVVGEQLKEQLKTLESLFLRESYHHPHGWDKDETMWITHMGSLVSETRKNKRKNIEHGKPKGMIRLQ